MIHRRQARSAVLIAGIICAVLASGPSAVPAADKDPAGILPADCFMMVTIPSVTETIAHFKKTNFYGLYTEPAMRQFIEPAEKNIRKFIEDELKKVLKGAGINSSLDSLPWPKGRVTLATRMGNKTIKVPRYDWDNYSGQGEPKLLGQEERKINELQVLVLADMGDNAEKAKAFLHKLVAHQMEEDGLRRMRRTVRGVRLSILLPKGAKRPGDEAEVPGDVPIYGFKDSTLIFASNFKLVGEVLGLWGGADRPTFSSNAGYRQMMRELGKADVSMYLNIKSLIKMSIDDERPERREATAAVFRDFGADALSGLGAVLQVAPRDNEQFRIKMLLGIDGEPRGLVKLLIPGMSSTNPGRLLTKGLATFIVANYDLGKMYDQICLLVRKVGNIDVDAYVQTAMKATKPPVGGEPVNARTEIFGQLTGPITFTSRLTKPYTAPDSSQAMVAVGVRNGRVLDNALGRIHNIMIAGGNPKLRRELRKRNVYLLGGNLLGALMGMAMGPAAMKQEPIAAFAVADDHLVIGSIESVEQSIRDLGRKDIEAIGADAMYQHASRYLPAQASMYIYENAQINTAAMWAQLRAAAKAVAKNSPGGVGAPGGNPRNDIEKVPELTGGLNLPMLILVSGLRGTVDFSALPDFEAVRKHLGSSVTYVKGTDEGIFAEMIGISAPGR
jgi:hypothetical protein